MGRHVLIELAQLIAGLVAVLVIDLIAVWAYRLGAAAIDAIAWAVAIGIVLYSIPGFRAAWRKDRGHD